MGLISKIEDKLHSDKGGSSSNDSSKLQKGSYEDSSSSHLRHPVGSGSTTQGMGSSTGSSGAGAYGTPSARVGSGAAGSSGMPGSGVERDGYGRTSDTAGGYSSSKPQDVTSGGYGSSRTDPRDAATAGSYGREPREPYDPYSSKGQTTAANAASGYPGGTSRDDYGSSQYANDPNVPRSREGGIMNPGSDPNARNPESIPTAGGQRVGSTSVNDPYSSSTQDPYSTSTTQSSGHPIRNAAMGGGAGAAAGGAAGYGASQYGGSGTHDPSMASGYGQHASSNPQDISYMNRSAGGTDPSMMATAQPGSTTMGSSQPTSGMGNTSPTSAGAGAGGMGSGMSSNDPRKMGGAYEAGYRDAMEHAKAEMGMK